MSSWKNASKSYQKPHRERHQPEARTHLGILEKKKDYKHRADDYNSKKTQLQHLHKKALDRNTDEFYYHMINSGVQDNGEHVSKSKEKVLTPEQIALMQTQDYNYVSSRRVMELKKTERLQATLHLKEQSAQNNHTFFVDSAKELRQFRLAKRLDTPTAMLTRKHNRLRNSDLQKNIIPAVMKDPTQMNVISKLTRRSYKELEKRKERLEKLNVLQRKIEIKRALQDKTRTIKKRVHPETATAAPVYIWDQIRKK